MNFLIQGFCAGRGDHQDMRAVLVLLVGLGVCPTIRAIVDTEYYTMLNVNPTATDREIRQAFKKLGG